jgi:hypothetical protein
MLLTPFLTNVVLQVELSDRPKIDKSLPTQHTESLHLFALRILVQSGIFDMMSRIFCMSEGSSP